MTTITVDYALLAGASYFDTRNEINRFPLPSGWTRISRIPQESSGFEVSAFGNGVDITTSSEIVISYAGTYDKSFPDLLADLNLAQGVSNTQLLQAAQYYLDVKAGAL